MLRLVVSRMTQYSFRCYCQCSCFCFLMHWWRRSLLYLVSFHITFLSVLWQHFLLITFWHVNVLACDFFFKVVHSVHFLDQCTWLTAQTKHTFYLYEGRLISNAHSEISRKRDHVFKQMKVGSKVQYFSYKLTYSFFDIVALSFNAFFPM